MSDDLTKLSSENIKYLTDIKNYNETHEKDFKQVFFKVDPNEIKSTQVGAFIKDVYGKDQVKPVYTVPGFHTQNTCKMNTAIYANEKIDYNSAKNYTPGINEVRVSGDFANSPNYFLTSPPANANLEKVSVEISGYISAKTPGKYKVAIVNFPQYLLAWVGNNAQKTYRKENAMFIIENGVKNKDEGVMLVAGQYIPFRVQYSYRNGDEPIDYTKLFSFDNIIFIDTFAKGPDTSMYYYSLTPSDTANLYTCSIYNGSDLQKYKSDEKQQVKIAWSKDINKDTEFICLDMTGDLWTYNSSNEKIEMLFKFSSTRQDCALILYDEPDKTDIIVIQNNNGSSSKVFINGTQIGVKMSELVSNEKWKNESSQMLIQTMSNKEMQVDSNKKLSAQRITETNPLYSNNFKLKLCIIKDNNGNKMIALVASTMDPEKFYTADPDLKMNKLFYANTNAENKFLREVPVELQTNGNTYNSYLNMYPLNPTDFTETPYLPNNNCKTQCNATLGCNYFYKVTDAATNEQKCLLSNNNSNAPTFLPKFNSKYSSSRLYLKRKIIKTEDANKDAVYKKAKYIPNGYKDTVNLKFSDYQIESKPLSETDTPGPAGTSYVVELQNLVSQRTSNAPPISLTNTNSPMIAGAEPFTVADRSLAKLDEIETQFSQYASNVYKINPNRIDISNNLTSINKNYLDMSENQQKYDFTGSTIYSLEKEDRSISSALLKDNAIYKEEQNTLYMVTTLTMATLLVTAILISK